MIDEFEQAIREGELTNQIAHARDLLKPISSGLIDRGHCVGTRECYGGVPGKRKTKLKDAVAIAKTVEFVLNTAINRYEEYEERAQKRGRPASKSNRRKVRDTCPPVGPSE